MLKIIGLPTFLDNYIWLIYNQRTHASVIVDPGEAQSVLTTLSNYGIQLSAILITHHHRDHTGGISDLLQHFSVPVYGPEEEIPGISHPLTAGQTIFLKEIETNFKILHTPGHTKKHIVYVNDRFLFAGDTLFTGGCGRLFEGSPHEMYHSLNTLMQLPTHTLLYCGHEYTENNLQFAYMVEPHNRDLILRINHIKQLRQTNKPTVPSTLLLEKKTNPFLRTHIETVKIAAEEYCQRKLANPIEVFTVLRQWKDELIN